MRAEIISVGTELLLGDIVNSNAQFLSRELAALGIDVYYQSTVGDNVQRFTEVLINALTRSDLIITTGGLGPTDDDITCETVCKTLDVPRTLHLPSLERIQEHFAALGQTMPPQNRKQAMLPYRGGVLTNTVGTAPGCVIEKNHQLAILLPGPPRELIPMFERDVRPFLEKLSRYSIVSHTVRIFGVGESRVEQMIGDLTGQANPSVAPYAKECEVMLRVTAKAETPEQADAMCAPVLEEIKERLGSTVYGVDVESQQEVIVQMLRQKSLWLATAESCTAGLLSKMITDIPGSSAVFSAGVAAYENQAKVDLLGVPPGTIAAMGAVSRETACSMALGACEMGRAHLGVGITGIAGPDGGTPKSPVGTVYVALTDGARVWCRLIRGLPSQTRESTRLLAASHALDMLRRFLQFGELPGETSILLKATPQTKQFLKMILPAIEMRAPRRAGFIGFLATHLPWKGDSMREILRKTLFLVALLVFIGTASYLVYDQIIGPWQEEAKNDGLQSIYQASDPVSEASTSDSDDSDFIASLASTMDQMPRGFEQLCALNPDFKGWVSIPGTKLDYPVVQTTNNEDYLYRDFYKKESKYGVPFFDYRNKLDGTDPSLIIYGHRVENGTMFGSMENYKDLNYYKEHSIIKLDTLDGQGTYEIFSVFYASTRPEDEPNFYYLYTDFPSKEAQTQFLRDVKIRSLFNIPVDVTADDNILMLSSCSHLFKDARIVLAARKLKDGEAAVDPSLSAKNGNCLMPEVWYRTHPNLKKPDVS